MTYEEALKAYTDHRNLICDASGPCLICGLIQRHAIGALDVEGIALGFVSLLQLPAKPAKLCAKHHEAAARRRALHIEKSLASLHAKKARQVQRSMRKAGTT